MAAFDWTQYFHLARDLSTRPEEAALRSAISRAYYAAYNVAEIYLTDKGIPKPSTGNSHKDVWDAFLRKGGRTFTSVADKGDRLRRKRTQADYDSILTGLSSKVTDSLNDANAILSYLKPSVGSPTSPTPASSSSTSSATSPPSSTSDTST